MMWDAPDRFIKKKILIALNGALAKFEKKPEKVSKGDNRFKPLELEIKVNSLGAVNLLG